MSELSGARCPDSGQLPLVVGAYATLGATIADPVVQDELQWLMRPELRAGVEIPFRSGAPTWSDPEACRAMSPQHNVITLLAALVALAERGGGLAAADDTARRAAVDLVRDGVRFAHEMLDHDEQAVIGLVVTSGPSAAIAPADATALRRSLAEIREITDVPVIVEHCDALIAGQQRAKGYLALSDELDAAAETGTLIALNWARSAIEGRDPSVATRHVDASVANGALGGAVLSGCAGTASRLGPAWADGHMPLRETSELGERWGYCGDSLLDLPSARDWLEGARRCDALLYQGIKIGVPADFSAEERLTTLRHATGLGAELVAS